jgi:hypothetical protein
MVTAEQIASIAESPNSQVQRQIVWLEAPADAWQELIRGRPELRRAVALNKQLPAEVLAELAGDDDVNLRVDIAMKRRLPRELFLLLANDADESVRHRVAFNAKTPIDIVRLLAEDSSTLVSTEARRRLAREE